MSHFVTEADRRVIHADWWADDETVTIKRFTFVDNQRIADLSTAGPVIEDDDGTRRVKVDMALWHETRLCLGIVDWTLRNGADEPVPCLNEHKCALSDRDGKFIHDAISEFNPARSAEEQESF